MNGALKSLQLLIGILAGLVGLVGILGASGYYFFVTQMSTRPPKPIFAEERDGGKSSAVKPKAKAKVSVAAKPTQSPVVKAPQNPNAPEKLPPEAYDAKVVWKDGLSLKKEPNSGAEKLGGVAFNAKVAIVKTSDDKQWVLIQSETGNLQGWVKAGNIDKAAAAANEEQAPLKPSKPKVNAKPQPRPKPQADAETAR
ncbi:SH3 domain-containing protein [Chamaesiphon sp. VAR_48_metabat_135_sub]|uniref:SH3 domain-containing protein n=1 Tax=Chamaesiphon sp. VAR_48_metabat_135_sub TaxID=2964699 RepID=UPI00286D29DB|nr:SH3 domain-containing protein [Chamaesiphon sp. VAR_48_metabat_135_sub]